MTPWYAHILSHFAQMAVTNSYRTVLPPSVRVLNVENLGTRDNRTLPKSWQKLSNLEELNLQGGNPHTNYKVELKNLAGLTKLRRLSMHSIQPSSWSPVLHVSSLTSLTLVEVYGEDYVGTLERLTQLRHLHISDSMALNRPINLAPLTNLESLTLARPRERPVVGWNALCSLTYLNVTYTRTHYTVDPEIATLTNLTELTICAPGIRTIDGVLEPLVKLVCISITATNCVFPTSLVYLTNLEMLYLNVQSAGMPSLDRLVKLRDLTILRLPVQALPESMLSMGLTRYNLCPWSSTSKQLLRHIQARHRVPCSLYTLALRYVNSRTCSMDRQLPEHIKEQIAIQ